MTPPSGVVRMSRRRRCFVKFCFGRLPRDIRTAPEGGVDSHTFLSSQKIKNAGFRDD